MGMACRRNITPDREVDLKLGDQYELEVRIVQDHRRCETPPDATVNILEAIDETLTLRAIRELLTGHRAVDQW